MDKACIIPWQSLMIRADGSIRPCCNSHRTLNSYANFDSDNIWNTDENVSLRRQMLTGELDNHCTVCKSRNVDPPEEIISKTYTEHAIFCENLPEEIAPLATAGPPPPVAFRPWPGAYVSFANGRAPAPSPRLALVIRHAGADTPEWYFLQGCDDEIWARARGIAVDESNIEVVFEQNALPFGSVEQWRVIAQFANGEYCAIPWKIHEDATISHHTLYLRDQRYPIISDLTSSTGISGHFDDCLLTGNVLRCRGWAFDRKRGRAPDRFAVFSRGECLAMSSPKGERYDVAKAMSSSKAVQSGFFFAIELDADRVVQPLGEIQVIALFGGSRALRGEGRAGLVLAKGRFARRYGNPVSSEADRSRPAGGGVGAWLRFLTDTHYAHRVGTAQAGRP